MFDYQSGSIKFDGIELKDIEKHYIRSKIGTVFQEPFLYNKTVRQNITITNQNASDEQIINASNIASISKDIATFKDGYSTPVGEKGTTISGGQKQRIAISRILVDNKKIIIFDDALSAVDTTTDREIREALQGAKEETKATTIIVTHRISTAKEADLIIVLENGKVAAQGTHDELVNIPGLYQKIWLIQGKLEEEFLNEISNELATNN
jgi:ATP-binding cassette subfamily B protein